MPFTAGPGGQSAAAGQDIMRQWVVDFLPTHTIDKDRLSQIFLRPGLNKYWPLLPANATGVNNGPSIYTNDEPPTIFTYTPPTVPPDPGPDPDPTPRPIPPDPPTPTPTPSSGSSSSSSSSSSGSGSGSSSSSSSGSEETVNCFTDERCQNRDFNICTGNDGNPNGGIGCPFTLSEGDTLYTLCGCRVSSYACRCVICNDPSGPIGFFPSADVYECCYFGYNRIWPPDVATSEEDFCDRARQAQQDMLVPPRIAYCVVQSEPSPSC